MSQALLLITFCISFFAFVYFYQAATEEQVNVLLSFSVYFIVKVVKHRRLEKLFTIAIIAFSETAWIFRNLTKAV